MKAIGHVNLKSKYGLIIFFIGTKNLLWFLNHKISCIGHKFVIAFAGNRTRVYSIRSQYATVTVTTILNTLNWLKLIIDLFSPSSINTCTQTKGWCRVTYTSSDLCITCRSILPVQLTPAILLSSPENASRLLRVLVEPASCSCLPASPRTCSASANIYHTTF